MGNSESPSSFEFVVVLCFIIPFFLLFVIRVYLFIISLTCFILNEWICPLISLGGKKSSSNPLEEGDDDDPSHRGNSESSSSDNDDPSNRAQNESFPTALKVGWAIAGAGSNHEEYETDQKSEIDVMLEGEDLEQVPREVTWRPPSPGWCKVNSDASQIRESARAGLGFLIRDEDSDFVACWAIAGTGSNHDEYDTDQKSEIDVMLEGEDLEQAPREVTWRPPNPGWCKVNSDASRNWKPRRAGLGFIIRDEDSDFVAGAAFRVKLDDISILELMAAAKGLKRAVELGFQRVWLESDCQTVVAWIQGQGKPSLTAILILNRIDVYVSKLKDFSISHIHREGNEPADFLASLNHKMGVTKINLRNMPPKLQGAIESDKRRYCAQLRRR
ncbi:hypothetical protein QJS04_geneDACA011193 [Acorus gramineus]|uniref:RNase H type-1 domain-containing protein n=1 Tax=Acorus gramineus TaxID=55184 RepID=A0AAV9AN32_ACOGR|nr:hypothetical protein QJS04_geneDACA011193 [Acorus gramineus]